MLAVVVLVVASVFLLFLVPGGGLLSAILLGAAKGCLIGLVSSVAINGAVNVCKGTGFWDGALDAAFSGAIGGFIGGGITGGLLGNAATMGKVATKGLLKAAHSFWGAVGQGAFVGAVSTAASSAGVTALSYWIENGTLNGAGEYILLSAFSGALSGGILGGIISGAQFKIAEIQALKKYGNGNYEHNPSDNPKVLADAMEDPDAVYGYRPKEGGSLPGADKDWSNSEFVESCRQERLKYIQEDMKINDLINEMQKNGCSIEEIAEEACNYRNTVRLNSYIDSDGNIINQSGYEAALKRMETRSYSSLIERGKTPQEIIESSMRTNPAMDACVGLYDDMFDTYTSNKP